MKLFKFKAVPPKAEIAAGIVLLVIMILPVVAAVLIAEYFSRVLQTDLLFQMAEEP